MIDSAVAVAREAGRTKWREIVEKKLLINSRMRFLLSYFCAVLYCTYAHSNAAVAENREPQSRKKGFCVLFAFLPFSLSFFPIM